MYTHVSKQLSINDPGIHKSPTPKIFAFYFVQMSAKKKKNSQIFFLPSLSCFFQQRFLLSQSSSACPHKNWMRECGMESEREGEEERGRERDERRERGKEGKREREGERGRG
jgi:hypothetical protein